MLNIFGLTFMKIFSENLRNVSPKAPFSGTFSLQEHQTIHATV